MKNKSVYEVLISKGRVDDLGIFLQCLILVCLCIVAIASLFLPELKVAMHMLLGCTFFVMAYNNYRVFRRKGATFLYAGMGALFIYLTGMMILGK